MNIPRFTSVGLALLIILFFLNVVGWIESVELRDKYRHCMTQQLDEPMTTDAEIEAVVSRCETRSGYEVPRRERP